MHTTVHSTTLHRAHSRYFLLILALSFMTLLVAPWGLSRALAVVTPEPWVVTLNLSDTEVAPGETVTYSGSVKTDGGADGSGTVTVQKRRAGTTSWSNWRTKTLNASGEYSVNVAMTTADRDWEFRTRMPGDASNATGFSPTKTLTVLPPQPWVVTLSLSDDEISAGETVTYSGSVKTAAGANGAGTVTLQKRRLGSSWRNWRTKKLNSNGEYAIKVAMTTADREWEFRTRMLASGTNLKGFSPTKSLTVLPPSPWVVTLTLSDDEITAGETVKYSGTVKSAGGAAGRGKVTLQKRAAGSTSWSNWRTKTLSSGKYAVSVAMTTADREWEFRTRMPANSANQTGFSPTKTLTVLPLGTLRFADNVNVPVGARPWGVCVDDFNNDGKPDMASADWADSTATVKLGNGGGGFSTSATVDILAGDGTPGSPYFPVSPHSIATGHVNADAHVDLVVTGRTGARVFVALGDGDGTFGDAAEWQIGDSPKQLVVTDLNGDDRDDVAVATNGENGLNVRLANSDGTLQPRVTYPTGAGAEAVAVGKFNADAYPDLAVGNQTDNNVSILLGVGDGTFAAAVNYASGSFPHDIDVGDFNDDGKQDLAIANYSGNSVAILFGGGDGTFTPQPAVNGSLFSVPSAAIASADFNGDGIDDLAVADWSLDQVVVLYGNGDGTFDTDDPQAFAVGDEPNAMAFGDFDKNGLPDIVVAQSGTASSSLGVLINKTLPPL